MNSRLVLIGFLTLLPSVLFAATECRVVELPDRYEAICEGNEKIMAGSYGGDQRGAQRITEQSAKVNDPIIQSSPVSLRDGSGSKAKSTAVERLIAYRQNKLQRSDVEAKKAIRMQNIKSGRQHMPEPEPQEQTTGDI